MKKLTLGMALLLVVSFCCVTFVKAQSDSAELNVNVVERKSTDTENDFNYQSLGSSDEQGRVLGAQTQRAVSGPTKINFTRSMFLYLLTNNFTFVVLDYYFNK